MSDRLQELLNRKPIRWWGTVTIKEFERDITYLQNVVKEQQQEIERLQTIEKAYEAMKKAL